MTIAHAAAIRQCELRMERTSVLCATLVDEGGLMIRAGAFLAIYILFVALLTVDLSPPKRRTVQGTRLPIEVVLLLPALIGGHLLW